jgi:uncharacterized protein YecT (DUF1311 family)
MLIALVTFAEQPTVKPAAKRVKASAADELTRLQQRMDAATSQRDMNIASGDLAKYWDRELEKEETIILKSSDPEYAKLFRSAQKSWREFRSAETELHCHFYRSGSIQPLVYNTTYASLTEQRLKELRALKK